MKWIRPLEQFVELALVLWLWDLFIQPLYTFRAEEPNRRRSAVLQDNISQQVRRQATPAFAIVHGISGRASPD